MAWITNKGIRIHYQIEGEGPPLLLMHGLAQSIATWQRRGFAASMREDHTLILVDARGHGLSDKPHDPQAYGQEAHISDVLCLLDDLHIDRVNYLGWSMGARTGWGLAFSHPNRLRRLILGGASPFPVAGNTSGWLKALEQGMDTAVAAVKPAWGEYGTPDVEAEFRANDPLALHAVLSAPHAQLDAEKLLPETDIPCLLFGGELDPFYSEADKCVELMPNANQITLDGFGHAATALRLDLVLPHIRELLTRIERGHDHL